MSTDDPSRTSGGGHPGDEPRELLRQASEAAGRADMRGTLDAIQRSEVFDGFLRRLVARWPSLHEMDLSALLWSETIDAFYDAVRAGERIANIPAWLWKVAWIKACDLHNARCRERPLGDLDPPTSEQSAVWDDREERRAARSRTAIELARGLLPRLGEENVRLVVGYILDAYAAGHWDIPTEEIATALGKSSDYVRQWRSRGFRRIIREAKKERLVNPDFDLSQFEAEATDDEADEEAQGDS